MRLEKYAFKQLLGLFTSILLINVLISVESMHSTPSLLWQPLSIFILSDYSTPKALNTASSGDW